LTIDNGKWTIDNGKWTIDNYLQTILPHIKVGVNSDITPLFKSPKNPIFRGKKPYYLVIV
jgi:hypothetical protein